MDEKKIDELIEYTHTLLYANEDKTFSKKIGGTVYEVTMHFDKDSKDSVFQQFKRLILESSPNRTSEKQG